jgi:hypothetical protein
MAKKVKRVDVSKPEAEPQEDPAKVVFQVRFDADVHRDLKLQAEIAGISLNQLIQGICRGAVAHLVQGEASIRNGFVTAREQRKCVFFGRQGIHYTENEAEAYRHHYSGDEPPPNDNGDVWFGLDFSERGFVRY